MIVAVDTRKAVVSKSELLTSGSAGIEAAFRFSADWDGLGKIAVFKGSGVSVDVALTDTTCVIPAEALAESGMNLYIGVYGTDGTGNIIIPTIWANAGMIRAGTEPGGTTPIEPTPSVVDQILAAATEAAEVAQSVRDDADSGAFDGATGPQGPQGPPGPAEVFWAEYGTTTNAEIEAAYQAGQIILCNYNNRTYRMGWRVSETRHRFFAAQDTFMYGLSCFSDVWRTTANQLEEAGECIRLPYNPETGDFLVYDGTAWVAQTVPNVQFELSADGILSIGGVES